MLIIMANFSFSYDLLIPAVVALFVSGITLLVTYITSDRRAKFDAAFEAAKYREKWLSMVREEVVEYCVVSTKLSLTNPKSADLTEDLITRRIRLQLSIPKSNIHYDDFEAQLEVLFLTALSEPALKEAKSLKEIIIISDKILKGEWDEIQQLLATGIKKEKKKNAKN